MKKKAILPLLVAGCLAFAACGNTADNSPSSETEASAVSDVSDLPGDGGQKASIREEQKGVWLLTEHDGITVEWLNFPDPDTFEEMCFLRFRSPVTENRTVSVSDIIINGRYTTGDEFVYWEDEGQNLQQVNLDFINVYGGLQEGEERRISCHVAESLWDDEWTSKEILWETDCELVIPAGFSPEVMLTGEKGVQALEQVLLDKGGLRLTLTGLGTLPDGYWKDYLYCFLKLENNTDRTVPFQANGISLNGAFFGNYGSLYHVEPGCECYVDFYVTASDLEESGIEQVGDVSLLLLTDEKENSGFINSAGGSWYPVELSVKSQASEAPEIDRLLFENEYVQVGFTGTGEREGLDGDMYYDWYLLVKNISDTNVELRRASSEDDSLFWWVSQGEIGAGNWRYVTVNYRGTNGEPRPVIEASFRGVTPGGGGILFEETEPVILPDE